MFNYVKPNKNMKTLHKIIGTLVHEEVRRNTMDKLFNWYKVVEDEYNNYCGIKNKAIADTNYLNPNYQLFFFNAISEPEIANNLVALFHTNIAVPISHILDHDKRKELGFVLGINDYAENPYGYPEGVYIAEYHRMTRSHMNTGLSAFKYMINGKGFLADPEQDYKIKEVVAATKRDFSQSDYNKITDVRMLYFIPKQEFIDNDSIFIPKLNIVIANMAKNTDVYHPLSVTMTHDIEGLSLDNASSVTYEIVKNKLASEDPNTYYIKTGRTISSIKITLSDTREEGAYKKEYLNGMVVSKDFCSLTEMGEKFGIYHTRQLAEAAGDLSKLVELEKTKNDFSKLNLEKEKVDLALEELEKDKNKLSLEFEKLKLESKKLEQDYIKLEKEKEAMEAKHAFELEIMKHKLEVASMELDRKKLDELLYDKKSNLDLEFQRRKMAHDVEMFRLNEEYSKVSHERSLQLSYYSTTTKTISSLATIATAAVGLIKLTK